MPVCPAGFVALGGVMTEKELYPQQGICYCLAAEHVERAPSMRTQFFYQHGEHMWDNPEKKKRHREIAESLRIVTADASSSQRGLLTLSQGAHGIKYLVINIWVTIEFFLYTTFNNVLAVKKYIGI